MDCVDVVKVRKPNKFQHDDDFIEEQHEATKVFLQLKLKLTCPVSVLNGFYKQPTLSNPSILLKTHYKTRNSFPN